MNKMKVELLYFDGCPSWQSGLQNLHSALEASGLDVSVELVQVLNNDDAAGRKFLGSPSFRVNGVDLWWEEKLKGYVANLQAGIEELNKAIPKTPEEQHRVFLMKKHLVDELVAEAMINGKRDIQVEFRAKILDQEVSQQLLDFPNGGEIVVRL